MSKFKKKYKWKERGLHFRTLELYRIMVNRWEKNLLWLWTDDTYQRTGGFHWSEDDISTIASHEPRSREDDAL